MQRLKGQSALVTGSSSGIGKAIALAIAGEGANVAINFHSNASSAEKVVKEIISRGGNAIAVGADVSKEPDVIRMFAQAIEAFGAIDILVNNAGLQKDAPLVEMTLADWEKVIGINLTGQFLCAREAAKEFIRHGIVEGRSLCSFKRWNGAADEVRRSGACSSQDPREQHRARCDTNSNQQICMARSGIRKETAQADSIWQSGRPGGCGQSCSLACE